VALLVRRGGHWASDRCGMHAPAGAPRAKGSGNSCSMQLSTYSGLAVSLLAVCRVGLLNRRFASFGLRAAHRVCMLDLTGCETPCSMSLGGTIASWQGTCCSSRSVAVVPRYCTDMGCRSRVGLLLINVNCKARPAATYPSPNEMAEHV
jgi:hypothetical protein